MVKLIAFLALLIAALQYRLWLGDGGITEYREITQRIEELKQEAEQRRVRNAAVAADVADLRDGTDAIEERARHDLGMVKPGESYVQIYDAPPPPPSVNGMDATLKQQAPSPQRKPPAKRTSKPSQDSAPKKTQ